MTKIGLLSDTHGFLNPRAFDFFKDVDEIWHTGDIGSIEVTNQLEKFKPLRAVYGNIDGTDIRIKFPEIQLFTIEETKILLIHIGGYPGNYKPGVKQLILKEKPDIFACGHSHILKVIYDKNFGLLHINPGAAGNSGFHHVITMLRFDIDKKDIKNLEILEIQR